MKIHENHVIRPIHTDIPKRQFECGVTSQLRKTGIDARM